jgi:hypothetical protein
MNQSLQILQSPVKKIVYIALRICTNNTYPEMQIRVRPNTKHNTRIKYGKYMSTEYLDSYIVEYNAV